LDRQKKYNREYYEKNKEKIREKRKKRYWEKAGVRKAAMERAAKYREEERMKRGKDRRGRKKGPLEPCEIETNNGRTAMAYSTGYVARELGIAIQTLHKWAKLEKIPVTPYWLANGRWWTKRMLNALLKAKKECRGRGGVRAFDFPDLARKYWPEDEM